MDPTLILLLVFGAVSGAVWFLWWQQKKIKDQIEANHRQQTVDDLTATPTDPSGTSPTPIVVPRQEEGGAGKSSGNGP